MALTITITNPHTISRIEQEAADRGVSPTTVVDDAFADRRDDTPGGATPPAHRETPEERAARIQEARRLIAEMQSMMTDEDRAFDYNAWLYDEQGLPH